MFDQPTHSQEESNRLYDYLNRLTFQLLSEGKSVIFDTSFNFLKDRNNLRDIAEEAGADTIVVWVNTPKDLSKERALHGGNTRNHYDQPMTEDQFERIAHHLEVPDDNEKYIKIDGTNVDKDALLKQLSL